MTASGRLAGRRAVVTVEATAELVRGVGGSAWHVVADLADMAAVERLLAAASERMGGADLQYANAGGSRGETVPFLEMTPESGRRMLDRNLTTASTAAWSSPATWRAAAGARSCSPRPS